MRTPPSSTKTTPCCIKVGLKRGPWTPEEDELLSSFINREGEGKWRTLPKRAGLLRCGKSCRLRWMNYLRPCVKRGHIAPDEEDLILRLHRLLGNRWSLIAGRIPGRTDNEIKNYWNTHLSKKLISQGIDPRTHKPLSDASKLASEVVPPNPNLGIPDANYNSDDSNSGVVVGGGVDADNSPMDAFRPNLDTNGLISMDFNEKACGESRGSFEEKDEDLNYCSDEVFSSFLNSLINEDMFTSQSQQQLPRYDALAFGAPSWDAPQITPNIPPDDHINQPQ